MASSKSMAILRTSYRSRVSFVRTSEGVFPGLAMKSGKRDADINNIHSG